ncbi:MAG: response regulator transcription factor [Myxococcota bacterium]
MSDNVVVRLLIVDDDDALRHALRNAITSLIGWTVVTATDPVDAQQHYASVDVVMSDWNMPLGGGARVIEEARCPVLIYSAEQVEHIYRLRKPAALPAIHAALVYTMNSKNKKQAEG